MNDKDEHCHQMKPILEIHESDFEMKVLKSKQPVLVNFWADWSRPCRRLGPVLEEVAAVCEGRVKVVKVNADDHPGLGLWYRDYFRVCACASGDGCSSVSHPPPRAL